MPELPEVEIMRRYFNEVALQQEIVGVEFLDPLNKVFATPRNELEQALVGAQFLSTRRTGKYLFAELSNGQWLHLHFGMTGDLELFPSGGEIPKYTRFIMVFKNSERLAFRDLRKFGVIELVSHPERFMQDRKIGPDLLNIASKDFIAAFKNRKAPIKSLLLQQNKVAGIGNWIADEMLFEAAVHPETHGEKLTLEELDKLYQAGQKIVQLAIDFDTHYGDFPASFFVNYRKKGARHPQHPNSPIEGIKVGGRGTFFVPERQVKR